MPPARPCSIELDTIRGGGLLLRGACGETCVFGANEIVLAEHFSADACEAFRETVLRIFGPNGKRSLGSEAYFPYEGLGRKPGSRAPEE